MESMRWRRDAGRWSWRKLTCSRKQSKKRPKRAEVQWRNIKGPWEAETTCKYWIHIADKEVDNGRRVGGSEENVNQTKRFCWSFFLRCQRITLTASGQSLCARKCNSSFETAMLYHGKIPKCSPSIMGRIFSITSLSKPRWHIVNKKKKRKQNRKCGCCKYWSISLPDTKMMSSFPFLLRRLWKKFTVASGSST